MGWVSKDVKNIHTQSVCAPKHKKVAMGKFMPKFGFPFNQTKVIPPNKFDMVTHNNDLWDPWGKKNFVCETLMEKKDGTT